MLGKMHSALQIMLLKQIRFQIELIGQTRI